MMKRDQKQDFATLLVNVTKHPECPPTLRERIYDALSTAAHLVEAYEEPCSVQLYVAALHRYDAGREVRI